MSTEYVTEADAFALVVQAKTGSNVGATDTFLVALRANLYRWIADIDAELAKRDDDRNRWREAREEAGEDDE